MPLEAAEHQVSSTTWRFTRHRAMDVPMVSVATTRGLPYIKMMDPRLS
ncbi:MAG: hypothetical protein AVDCRST_MAG33-1498 [uncultured Thermomicrobiales bacterium]|uniref:Uncharacterized protein n=1 Tax=uncultured Thermomicrobiales bacterium TaxID=1645740 RepID=A0A6J4UTN6_9BACT|nr:MAG: hypothetical protein AVDCRST_MAG33-1498 [uncultured Thermomicrobiales bacterium]